MARARKKATGKALANIEQMQEAARQAAEGTDVREDLSGGMFLKAQKGHFSIGDEELPDELPVIILDYTHEQALYPDEYDPKAPAQQPTCFAVAYNSDDLAPHADAEHPEADACDGCELNKWEGRTPPDCSQRRRIALIDVSNDDRDILLLSLSPGALKAWKSYPALVKKKTGMLVHNVMTTLSWDTNKKDNYGNPTLRFDFDDVINDPELFAAAIQLREDAKEVLLAPIKVKVHDDDGGKRKAARPPVKKSQRGKKTAKKASQSKKTAKKAPAKNMKRPGGRRY